MRRNEFDSRLAAIGPGQTIVLRFDGNIVSRDTYLRVNAAARRVFGVGRYKINKPRGSGAIRVSFLRAKQEAADEGAARLAERRDCSDD